MASDIIGFRVSYAIRLPPTPHFIVRWTKMAILYTVLKIRVHSPKVLERAPVDSS